MAEAATARTRRPAGRARPPRGRIRWDRLGRLALLAVLGVILLLYVSPTKHWIEQSGTRSAQKAELRDLSGENAHLKKRVGALRNPDTLEREARRLGMVKRGERSYVIENPPRR
jgi:cell division protein FtsB